MGISFTDPNPGVGESPFSTSNLRKSVEEEFFAIVPDHAHGATVAVLTPYGAKIAVGQRIGEHWEFVIQGNISYKGKVDGSIKILGTWGND